MPISNNQNTGLQSIGGSSSSTTPIYSFSPLQTPITIPPTPQATADTIWLCTLNINLSSGPNTPGLMNVSFAPMVSSTGQVFSDQLVNYGINDPIGTAATNQDLATLLDDINTLITDYCSANGLFGLTAAQAATPQASQMGD